MAIEQDWNTCLDLVQQIQRRAYNFGVEGATGVRLVGGGVTADRQRNRCIVFTRWQMPDGETYTGSINGPCATLGRYISAALGQLTRVASLDDTSFAMALQRTTGLTPAASSGFDFVGEAQRDDDDSNLHAHDFTIRRSRDGGWSGCVTIPTRAGNVSICASADERAIERALRDAMVQSGHHVGDLFGDISKGFNDMARGIAESRVFDRLGSAVTEAMHNPVVSTILDVASVVPGVGIGVTALRTAGTVVDQLQRGDATTTQRVSQVLNQAAQGDPHAQRATAAIANAAAQRGPGQALTTLSTLFAASQRQGGIQSRDIQNAGTTLLSDLGSLIHGPTPAASSGFTEVVGWDWYHRPAREQASLYSPRQAYLQGQARVQDSPIHDFRSIADVRHALGI